MYTCMRLTASGYTGIIFFRAGKALQSKSNPSCQLAAGLHLQASERDSEFFYLIKKFIIFNQNTPPSPCPCRGEGIRMSRTHM